MKEMEQLKPAKAVVLLDYAYRAYGDHDLLYGYRMLSTGSANMREALLNIQQRNYVRSLACLEKERKVVGAVQRRPVDEDGEEVARLPKISEIVD